MRKFSSLLREYRLRAHLSQLALAKYSGVDQSHINRLERGLRNPPKKKTILAIARGLMLNQQETLKLLESAGYKLTDEEKDTETLDFSNISAHFTIISDSDLAHPTVRLINEILSNPNITPAQKNELIDEINKYARYLITQALKENREKNRKENK